MGHFEPTCANHRRTSSADVIGVMRLLGSRVPTINLASKRGMRSSEATERNAVVVAEVHHTAVGLVVNRVPAILTIRAEKVQPIPFITTSFGKSVAEGIITHESGMICFLNLSASFTNWMVLMNSHEAKGATEGARTGITVPFPAVNKPNRYHCTPPFRIRPRAPQTPLKMNGRWCRRETHFAGPLRNLKLSREVAVVSAST